MAISRAEADRVSFAAEKKGDTQPVRDWQSSWSNLASVGRKKIHSGQGFHLSRVKSGTMSAKTLLPLLLSLQTNPLFPPFIPFHPFLRALTKASEPFIISLVTSSTGENFLATQLRLVRLSLHLVSPLARFFHSFLSRGGGVGRGGGGFFQAPRLDYAP